MRLRQSARFLHLRNLRNLLDLKEAAANLRAQNWFARRARQTESSTTSALTVSPLTVKRATLIGSLNLLGPALPGFT